MHVVHLLTLAARNQKYFFGLHTLGGRRFQLSLMKSVFLARHMPLVVVSGRSRKDATASPIVTSVGSWSFQTVRITRCWVSPVLPANIAVCLDVLSIEESELTY